mmetsp:Transcript_10356/g.9982  ORF Transcript_10356/g.9982 Transcript_10356/m.9982 type:complete len:541 (+) Transcript_10356:291-1913(+)|eukprot:CAMPEP_0119051794 /NCGR_PEP_ID=MMETSP1177-20130426/73287_1 /TAXON_ID=2985 /ORGANISM="Ochromonas sp, Strain CCMP1899" /LENGTH=540 /DNA_ID=CAMNT_0007031117 /DNA_START=222 /DNA_END=1844 /DNA_ORIENTATION=-
MNHQLIKVEEADDWNDQLKEIADNEEWENCSLKIPPFLQDRFAEQFTRFGPGYKIMILKLLDSFHWVYTEVEKILKLLEKTLNEKMTVLLELIKYFNKNFILLIEVIDLLSDIDVDSYLRLLVCKDDINRLIAIRRFLTVTEKKYMCELIAEMSIIDYFYTLDSSAEPLAKHCRLCRIRRLEKEEFLMHHEGMIPEGKVRIPGAINFTKVDIWAADDEKFFNFDFEHNVIFFKREKVDLVRICNNCFLDVTQAVASSGRFTDLYSKDGKERKEIMSAQKNDCMGSAILFGYIGKERARRRAREFSLGAIEKMNRGLKLEEDERIINEKIKNEKQAKMVKIEEKKTLLKACKVEDKKWLKQDKASIHKEIDRRHVVTALMNMPSFDERNQAPRTGPVSLLSLSDSKKIFNVGLVIPNDIMDPNDIRDYQEMVWQKTILRNQAEEETIKVAQKKLYDERQNALEVLREYMYRQHHKQRVAAREYENTEELRIDSRAADKAERRAIRIAGYEYAERVLMQNENIRSKEAQRLLYDDDDDVYLI